MELYDVFIRGIRRLLDIPIPEDLRKCKICKQTVPVCEMAVKAIPLGDGYWRPENAAHCIHCSEIRGIGVTDEDGHMKRLPDPWARRVDEGFTMLWEFGNFGEAPRF